MGVKSRGQDLEDYVLSLALLLGLSSFLLPDCHEVSSLLLSCPSAMMFCHHDTLPSHRPTAMEPADHRWTLETTDQNRYLLLLCLFVADTLPYPWKDNRTLRFSAFFYA